MKGPAVRQYIFPKRTVEGTDSGNDVHRRHQQPTIRINITLSGHILEYDTRETNGAVPYDIKKVRRYQDRGK